MKKGITLTLLVVGILFGATLSFAGVVQMFSDVPENQWFSDSVIELAEEGIITGYNDGTFGPAKDVNRAELAVILDRFTDYVVGKSNESNTTTTFSIAQKNAENKCYELYGHPYTGNFDDEYGEVQINCTFVGKECSQKQINGGSCFMESNEVYKNASKECVSLNGNPYIEFSELYNEDQVACDFGENGECTQNELLENQCFMENR